jgi:hypothetical protein
MYPLIEELFNSDKTYLEIQKQVNEYKAAIDIAEKILRGEYCYCKSCHDFYRTSSFRCEEVEKGKTQNIYQICPKGCKTILYSRITIYESKGEENK